MNSSSWLEDFKKFVEEPAAAPSKALSENLRSEIVSDLNPSSARVLFKLGLVLLFSTPVSLLLCPQFGFSLIRESAGLMQFFMQHGKYVCSLFCGAVFVGGAALAAGFMLRPEEIRALRHSSYLQFALLALLSLGAFVCLGADVLLNLALFWLLGAFSASVLAIEFVYLLRRSVVV